MTFDVTTERQIKPQVQGKICATVRSAFFPRGNLACSKKSIASALSEENTEWEALRKVLSL